VRAKDLSPQARTIQLGWFGQASIRALQSSRMASLGTATHSLSPARRWSSDLFIISKFVRGDARLASDASEALLPAASPRFDGISLGFQWEKTVGRPRLNRAEGANAPPLAERARVTQGNGSSQR
jgi:hypothetical protein